MDHDAEAIARDYDLSEKLGAELLLDPVGLVSGAAKARTRYETRTVRTVNLVTGDVQYTQTVEEIS